MSDRALSEGKARLYERARRDGFSKEEASKRVQESYDTVSRQIDAGKVTHPSDTRSK